MPQLLCYEDNNRPNEWIECIFSVHTALAKPVTCHALWTKDSLLSFTVPSACQNKWRKTGTEPKLFQFIAVQLIYGILLLNYFYFSLVRWRYTGHCVCSCQSNKLVNVMSHRVSWLIGSHCLPTTKLLFLMETYFVLFLFSKDICCSYSKDICVAAKKLLSWCKSQKQI